MTPAAHRRQIENGVGHKLDDVGAARFRPADHSPVLTDHDRAASLSRSTINCRCFSRARRLSSSARNMDSAISVGRPCSYSVLMISRWREIRFKQSAMSRSAWAKCSLYAIVPCPLPPRASPLARRDAPGARLDLARRRFVPLRSRSTAGRRSQGSIAASTIRSRAWCDAVAFSTAVANTPVVILAMEIGI